VCDYVDNDCDSLVDELLEQQCGVSNVGECQYGTSICTYGTWGTCEGNVDPTTEVCNGLDNDCDGVVDEGCDCVHGQIQSCGSNVGTCQEGNQTCSNGVWGACEGEIPPITEVCDGFFDENCDGQVDEGCDCVNGQTEPCGNDVGACEPGTRTCTNGVWGACVGEIQPTTEVCDALDNDCDGVTDEGCDCIHGQTQPCGSDVGACQPGTQTCTSGVWSACEGEVGPATEVCDGLDNDCNGMTDEFPVCWTCNDADGYGINLGGYVAGTDGYNNPYTLYDWCTSNIYLVEWTCSGNFAYNHSVNCQHMNYSRCGTGHCTNAASDGTRCDTAANCLGLLCINGVCVG
jgi:hypothetical protein